MTRSIPKTVVYLILLLSFSTLFTPAIAYTLEFSKDGEINISADELVYDKSRKTVEAKGNVKVTSGDTVLEAETLTYLEEENKAVARGNVAVRGDGDLIRGDALDYNFGSATGSIVNGEIFLKEDNYHIRGKRIDKVGERRYTIRGGSFTTCDGESPGWSVRASKVDVEIGEYLFADHARLYLKRLPLLYTPKFIAPIKTERQTGLLAPRIGYSDRGGFTYEQPFFWAISRSKDATITFIHEGNRGTGGNLEYRYARRQYSNGILDFKYMDERSPFSRNRWRGNYRHREDFAPGFYGRLDINAVSDRKFFLDYAEDVGRYSLQRLESKASVVKNWQNYSLIVDFRYFKNLVKKDDTTLQRLPQVTFTKKRGRIGNSPLFLQLDSRLDNFWRKEAKEASGLYEGQRLDFHPSVSLPINPNNIFELTPKLGFRETLYRTLGKQDRWDSREIYDFNLDFFLPVSRVYFRGLTEVKRFKHTVEPGFTYSYVPNVEQSDLPGYDGIDRIGKKKLLTLKLNNYIVTKRVRNGNISYHRLVDLNIYRNYDFHEAKRPLTSPADRRRPWGPVSGQLKITGERFFRLKSEIRYDTYEDKTTYLSADLEGRNSKDDTLTLSYRYSPSPEVRYLDSTVGIRPASFLKLAYTGRYSFVDDRFLETRYGAMFIHQCWSVAITYSERKLPREDRFFVVINLKGLGELGDAGGLF